MMRPQENSKSRHAHGLMDSLLQSDLLVGTVFYQSLSLTPVNICGQHQSLVVASGAIGGRRVLESMIWAAGKPLCINISICGI